MLTGRGKRNDDDDDDDGDDDDASPAKSHLLECVSSATAIITIFDLFCRTFTMNYCVLSLAYSVYTAASVFLLQVQASPGEQQATRKLEYCCQCLCQVKNISPGKDSPCRRRSHSADMGAPFSVINSALQLITSALNDMGLDVPSPRQSYPAPASTRCQAPFSASMYQNPVDVSRQMPLPSHPLFQPAMNHMLSPESMTMHPDVFETMSTLEPLSVRVGAIQGPERPSSLG